MAPLSETSFRVLDTLSRHVGTQLPISTLRERIEDRHGTAHYKNVHKTVTRLADQGVLELEEAGRTKLPSLALHRLRTLDLLTEVDLRSKRQHEHDPAASRIARILHQAPLVGTAFLVDADVNRTLNRLEIVLAARHPEDAPPDGPALEAQLTDLHDRLQQEAKRANVRLDALLLTEPEFKQGLSSASLHPVQAQSARRRALVDPQRFWWLIHEALQEGPQPTMTQARNGKDAPLDLVTPLQEAPKALAWNLDRFGYTEAGTQTASHQPACLEIAIAAALASNAPRRRYSSAILFSKNETNPRLMAFLTRKHGLAPELLGILDPLDEVHPSPQLDQIKALLPEDTEPRAVDRERLEQMLELYEPFP